MSKKYIKCEDPVTMLNHSHIVTLTLYRDSHSTYAVEASTLSSEPLYRTIIVRGSLAEHDAKELIKKLSK